MSSYGEYQPERAAIQVDAGIWQLDLGFQGRGGVVAAYLLIGGPDRLALIECGPASTLNNLRLAVGQAGFPLEAVTDLLVTHIHLDHAGAAGPLTRINPGLRVFAHPFGVPHMVDPSKLVSSASRIYGDQMDALWGEVLPVPAAQLTPIEDGQRFDFGEKAVTAHFSPGHAWHHVVFWDHDEGTLFTGDVGGVRMPGSDYVCPPTPPPDLDPDAWRQSLQAMDRMAARRWYLTHFGAVDDVPRHLAELEENLERFAHLGRSALEQGQDQETLTRRIEAEMAEGLGIVEPGLAANLEWATPSWMAAMGLARYAAKRAQQTTTGGAQ